MKSNYMKAYRKMSEPPREKIRGKSFFDLTDKEKAEVVNKAVKESNKEQKRLMATPTKTKKKVCEHCNHLWQS